MKNRKFFFNIIFISTLAFSPTSNAGIVEFVGEIWSDLTGGNVASEATKEISKTAEELSENIDEAIKTSGQEMRETLITTREELEKTIEKIDSLYDKNLEKTADTIDGLTTKKLYELEQLIIKTNNLLKDDIRLIGSETRKAIKELNELTSDISKHIENIIIVSGKTSVYVIDRSTNNFIVILSLVILAIGMLVFFRAFFNKKIPKGFILYFSFMIIFFYISLFMTLLISPYARAKVMNYTGIGLEQRIYHNKKMNKNIGSNLKPKLTLKNTENSIIRGNKFIKYNLEIKNYKNFPNELFLSSPELPACGRNTSSSRTWVDIFSSKNVRIYGFCAFSSSDNLRKLWFSVREGKTPPTGVYIVLHDRKNNIKYQSNTIKINHNR